MSDLSGITVVSLEQAVAAPYASSRLADAGARVIKLERTEGDFARHYDKLVQGHSAYFVWLNAGKESVTVNMKDPTDKELVLRILANADVFIQNLAPGAVSRLGLDPTQLHERFPTLIVCSISGYGEVGPYREQKAYDLLVQAESGLCSITGEGETQARVGVSVCDISAGMTAYEAILEALLGRALQGKGGRVINVSLYHALADWMNVPYLQHHYGGFTPQRSGLKHPSIAPYGAYRCADGKQVLISIQNEREWKSLCKVFLEQHELADDPRYAGSAQRVAHREDVDRIVGEGFQNRTREQNIKKLDEANIAYGRLSDLDDLDRHPQNRFRKIDVADKTIEVLGRGAEIVGRRADQQPRVPDLGEHSEAIRQEFG